MSTFIEAHISPCPRCGENRWVIQVADDVARKKRAKPAFSPRRAFDRGVAMGLIVNSRNLAGRFLFWRTLTDPAAEEPTVAPSTEESAVCANCGQAMSLTASGSHDWRFS